MENIQLTNEGAKTVLDALKNPPPVTDKLREAVESYKEAIWITTTTKATL